MSLTVQSEVTSIEALVNQGRYLEAKSAAEKIQEKNHRIKQMHALALSKLGMPELALDTINPVYQQFPEDPESAGILGSIYKELFKKNQKTSYAILSRDTYLKNFTATQNYYTGINAASMSAMAGQSVKGREIATQVVQLLEQSNAGFWELATLGEAYLLTKNRAKAIATYVDARKIAAHDWGKITSVHNQLWLLNHYLPVPAEVLKLFAPPNVVAFAGHMIDHPNRSAARFPLSIEHKVKEAIRSSIRNMNGRIGYTSLACGGDILFAEALLEEGGELNVILPFNLEDFIQTSIVFAGSNWVDRFHAIIKVQPPRFVTTGHYENNDLLFTLLSKVIFGSADLRSRATLSKPYLLTVQSALDLKKKEGGTRGSIGLWPHAENHVTVNPDLFVEQKGSLSPGGTETFRTRSEPDHVIAFLVYLNGLPWMVDEAEKIFDQAQTETPDIQHVSLEGTIIFSFPGELQAIEFVGRLQSRFLAVSRTALARFVLHVGTIGNPITITDECVKQIIEIGKYAWAEGLCVSQPVAATLALDNSSYNFTQRGIIQVEATPITLYQLDLPM